MQCKYPWQHFLEQQLFNAPQSAPERTRPHFNPRPPGVIQPGSATEAVLALLRAYPNQFFDREAIVHLTGRSGKSVDWALRFLRELGHVQVAIDQRSRRYHRYKFIPDDTP